MDMFVKYLIVAIVLFAIVVGGYLFFAKGETGITIIPTKAIFTTYGPQEEIYNVTYVDPKATDSIFACSSDSDCVDVHTQHCFNNAAFQQACINQNDSAAYEAAYKNFSTYNGPVCPYFVLKNNVSCSCIENGCSLVYQDN
jgi:hypothetical protein